MRSSISALVPAIKSLLRAELKNGTAMQNHIRAVEQAALAIENTGSKLPNHIIINFILANLPREYESVAIAPDTHDSVTMKKVRQVLLDTEASRSQLESRQSRINVTFTHTHGEST